MSYQSQAGDDFSDSQFLKTPGRYHLYVTKIESPVLDKDGRPMDWAAFKVHAEVLAGTADGQVGKTVQLTFRAPNLTHKDGGKFTQKIMDRFAIAINLLGPTDKGKRYIVDDSTAMRQQCIAHVDFSENQDGSLSDFLDLVGGEIYHVDDPAVRTLPKELRAIAQIPAALRRKPPEGPAASPVMTPTPPATPPNVAAQPVAAPAWGKL